MNTNFFSEKKLVFFISVIKVSSSEIINMVSNSFVDRKDVMFLTTSSFDIYEASLPNLSVPLKWMPNVFAPNSFPFLSNQRLPLTSLELS